MPVTPPKVPRVYGPIPPLVPPALIPPLVPPAGVDVVAPSDPALKTLAPAPVLDPPLAPEQLGASGGVERLNPNNVWYNRVQGPGSPLPGYRNMDAYFFATLARAIWTAGGESIVPLVQAIFPGAAYTARGTHPAYWDEWNLDGTHYVLVFPPALPAPAFAVARGKPGAGTMVPTHVTGAVDYAYSNLNTIFQAYVDAFAGQYVSGSTLVLTGCNQGGAVAQYLGMYLGAPSGAANNPRYGVAPLVYQFGPPAWGHVVTGWPSLPGLGGGYALGCRTFRVVNFPDPMTFMVQQALGGFVRDYRHWDDLYAPGISGGAHTPMAFADLSVLLTGVGTALPATLLRDDRVFDWPNMLGQYVSTSLPRQYTTQLRYLCANGDAPYPAYNYCVLANQQLDAGGV